MFQSRQIVQKMSIISQFLTKLADYIIQTQMSVQSKQFKLKAPFMQIYTIVYQFCIQKPSLQQKMLQQYKNALNYFLERFVQFQNTKDNFKLELSNSKKIIKRFNQLWVKYTKFMVTLAKKVFPYLDRFYLPGIEQGSLYRIGINILQKNICHETNLSFFYRSFIKEIQEIRSSKIIQNYQLLRFTEALAIIDMQGLLPELIKLFFDRTLNYYKETFLKIRSHSYKKYFQAIYNISLFEKALFQMCVCLNMFQRHAIMITFTQTLIKPITQRFTKDQQGLPRMFNNKDISYMKLVAQIYGEYDGFSLFRQGYYNYLLEVGQATFIKPHKKSETHEADIIYELYKQQLNLITNGFGLKKSQLLVTLNNAIEKLISKKESFTEQFYKFCMNILYNGTFQIKQNKQKITILLQKMFSKDQFIGCYESNLLQKLILKQKFNLQIEQSFIEHLNQIYGNQLTHKLSKKLKDFVQSTKDLSQPERSKNLNVTILSEHLWEKTFIDQISFKITLPYQLSSIWMQIQAKYISYEPKKKLTLLCYENKIVLNLKFNSKYVQIKCNLIEASILLLISSKEYCSETEIINNINIQKNVIQNAIEKFQQITPNIFIKTNLGDYLMNWNFVTLVDYVDLSCKESASKEKIIKFIEQDREILIQAAIVKFTKRAKRCNYQQIAQGVINSIRLFKPQIQKIKKTVLKLIKKGYIEQTEGQMFQYIE